MSYPQLYHTEAEKASLGPRELLLWTWSLALGCLAHYLACTDHRVFTVQTPSFSHPGEEFACKGSSSNCVELESCGLYWEG